MDEIVAFAELERFIDLPVRTYSSGMYMRLGFAIAAHLQADVLLLDEVFAVGDEEFQRKCFGKIFEFKQRGGTIVFVSHDASAVERLCERAVLLRQGRVEFDGPTHEALDPLPPPARRGARSRTSAAPASASGGAARRGSRRRCCSAPRASSASSSSPASRSRVRLRVVADRRDPAAAAVVRAARRRGPARRGRLAGHGASSAGRTGPAARALRFDVDRLPLSDGRFHLRFGLADADGRAPLPLARRRARSSSSIPPGEERGVVRLEGTWSMEDSPSPPKLGADELRAPAPTGPT